MCNEQENISRHERSGIRLVAKKNSTKPSQSKQDFLESFQESDAPVTLVRCRSESDISAGSNIPGLRAVARLWRKDPVESGSQSRAFGKLQARGRSADPCSDLFGNTIEREHTEYIKQRWRNQQIANQKKLAGHQKASWTSWLLRSRTPHFLRRVRSKQ